MSATVTELPPTTDPQSIPNRFTQRNNNRRRNRPPPNAQTNAGVSDAPGVGDTGTPRPRGGHHAHSERTSQPAATADGAPGPSDQRAPRRRNRNRNRNPQGVDTAPGPANDDSASASSAAPSGPRRPRRGAKFNGNLTSAGTDEAKAPTAPAERYTHPALRPGDLTSTLIHSLRTPPYPDCPICFASIHPAQPTWSCSPSIPVHADGEPAETGQCCWSVFHLKCIRAWASKSVKDVADAYRARGENKPGDWRCPGCQSKRTAVPMSYWCFCASTPDPKPPRLATPHSCGSACARTRACGHPCPLPCHPGPCPTCQVTTSLPCHCGARTLSFRCGRLAPSTGSHNTRGVATAAELSCGSVCGRRLGCGNHQCTKTCHEGPCGPCEVRETVPCYCGKEEKEVSCGEGEAEVCTVLEDSQEKTWFGRYGCENNCDRPFDCGVHRCGKPCHPPSRTPPPCPRSPAVLTHCPCGKHPIDPTAADYFPPGAVLTRTSCSAPVPTCTSLCQKTQEGCDHSCSVPCHTGPCPPCRRPVVRPCRCGHITRTMPCHELRSGGAQVEVLCDRPCTALRACGRHRCNRVCCPLAALSAQAGAKGKRRAKAPFAEESLADSEGLHECDLVCGKMLGCGNHTCEERDHRGACPPCLRSSFDEMICNCGRTVLMPPIACGTRLSCPHPCSRPPPPCGHGRTPHVCHADDVPCPPCPFLTRKPCACGKREVENVRCSLEKVACGTVCGKLLGCGFHRCTRLCHGDDCGACTTACGKPRRLCLPAQHPCTHPCHAPSSCPEGEPCMSTITLACACGRIQQTSPCGRSTASPAGRATGAIKCTNDCAIAKRNARLADALGISPDRPSATVNYSDELAAFARANSRFCLLVEKSFSDFITSEKRTQVLPHMPPERRKFVHDLAAVYRMDVQMVDQEPQRSVQLIRRVDTRIPTPLLSSLIASNAGNTSGGLGRLGTDLRPRAPAGAALPRPSAPATGTTSTGRGWTSVVAKPAPSAAPVQSSWGAPARPASARVSPKPASGTNTPLPSVPIPAAARDPADVPDNWEDDV